VIVLLVVIISQQPVISHTQLSYLIKPLQYVLNNKGMSAAFMAPLLPFTKLKVQ